MSRISHYLIGAAFSVPTTICLIAVGSNIPYCHDSEQNQSLPQKNKRFLDNPDSSPEHVDNKKTRKPK
jgi:hypothetical protein